MKKSGSPWYRSSHDAWYVWHGGRQVALAKGKENKGEAFARFAELLRGRDPAPTAAEVSDNESGRHCLPEQRPGDDQAHDALVLKLGLDKRPMARGYRHGFATDALAQGISDAQVAELLGHTDTSMIHRHYGHLSARSRALKEALNRVRS